MSCNAKREPNGTWRIQYRWTDWTGTKKKSQKRGFKTKKEAEEWYARFMLQQSSDPSMTLADFWEIYKSDMEKRLRRTTMKQKEYMVNLKEMQKEFMPEDAKVGIIQNWLDELSEDYVCSIMIYKEAFHHEYDTPKDWELKEINNVMNHSIAGWEKISSHRFKEYGIQRGWKRVTDRQEFQRLPENMETPFDKKIVF